MNSGLLASRGILKEANAPFYKWRSKYGGMDVSKAERLNSREDENDELKRLLADAMLSVSMPKNMFG